MEIVYGRKRPRMLDITSGAFHGAGELPPKPLATQKHKATSKKAAVTKPMILVVDDQQLVADTTAEILNKHGFRAICAYDGGTAVQMAAKLRPDYLLTDVLMPSMTGVELAIAIRRMLPSTKILLFSGQAGISDILRQGAEEGYVFPLVPKPIHPEKLIAQLRELKEE
jgi:CheY-like chemotaxis protein